MNWHALHEGEGEKLKELAVQYNLHPLHIEDCEHGGQNAKLEEDDNYLFVILKPVFTEDDGSLAFGDFDVFLGHDFLVTFEEVGCAKLLALVDKYDQQSQEKAEKMGKKVVDDDVEED